MLERTPDLEFFRRLFNALAPPCAARHHHRGRYQSDHPIDTR
jgi:hypothetical protein